MVAGFFMASWQATRLGQDKDIYLDLALWDIIFAIIGARSVLRILMAGIIMENIPWRFLNTRGRWHGNLRWCDCRSSDNVYFCKSKETSFFDQTDAACGGLLVGQIFGRWGNFFNREAFGGYTNNFFAMQLKRSQVRAGDMTKDVLKHLVNIDGIQYIQVHPTFLYELLWNIGVLAVRSSLDEEKKI